MSVQTKGLSNRNEVTGALLQTKPASEEYKNNYDAIFRKKEGTLSQKEVEAEEYKENECSITKENDE